MNEPLFIAIGRFDDAASLVENYHYSKRMAANVQMVMTWHAPGGLFGDLGDAIAAAVFSIPGTRWSEPVLELTRLVRAPTAKIQLSRLLSMSSSALARAGHELVVSFADRTQGHHGGIYQAASWNYDGCRDKRMDGLLIDGKFYPGRSCNSRWGTRSPTKLKAIKPTSKIEPHFDEGKHLYWKPLGPRGKEKAERLGLKISAYPKPNKEMGVA